ncbi:MAG: hypothetical protein R6U91_01705 [Bacillota bacterium]
MDVRDDELLRLSAEVKELSEHIARLKRRKNQLPEGPEKSQLMEDIKMYQFQALFYLEKMENLSGKD